MNKFGVTLQEKTKSRTKWENVNINYNIKQFFMNITGDCSFRSFLSGR